MVRSCGGPALPDDLKVLVTGVLAVAIAVFLLRRPSN